MSRAKVHVDLRGKTFCDWTVLDDEPVSMHGMEEKSKIFYMCRCKCGKEKRVNAWALSSGRSTKCKYCSKRKDGSAFRQTFLVYRKNAERRGYYFKLTSEEFLALTQTDCFYCGTKPSNKCVLRSGEIFVFSGVDRKDNSLGYDSENCTSCCSWCNRSKNTSSEKDFIDHCKKVARRFS